MAEKKNLKGLGEYLRERPGDEAAVHEVQISGQELESPWSKTQCAYWESAVLLREGGQVTGHTEAARSHQEISLILEDGTSVRVDRNMRLYMEPSWLEGEPEDHEARTLLSEARVRTECPGAVLAEFVLVPGKKYWARILREEYWLPPDRPDGEPRRARGATVYISDRPFNEGRPQGEPSPMSSWTY